MDGTAQRFLEIGRAMGDLIEPCILKMRGTRQEDCAGLAINGRFVAVFHCKKNNRNSRSGNDCWNRPARTPQRDAANSQAIDRGKENDSPARIGASSSGPALGWSIRLRRDGRWQFES